MVYTGPTHSIRIEKFLFGLAGGEAVLSGIFPLLRVDVIDQRYIQSVNSLRDILAMPGTDVAIANQT